MNDVAKEVFGSDCSVFFSLANARRWAEQGRWVVVTELAGRVAYVVCRPKYAARAVAESVGSIVM